MNSYTKRSAILLAVLANLLWGTSFYASKVTIQFWSPIDATLARFSLALTIMLISFRFFGYPITFPKTKAAWISIALTGVTAFGLLYPLQLQGLLYISSGLSSSLMLTSPLFVLILATLFLGETLSVQKLCAVGLGICGGAILVFSHGSPGSGVAIESPVGLGHAFSPFLLGTTLTLLASLSLAASVVVTRKFSAALTPQDFTFWSMLTGFVCLLPLSLSHSHIGRNVFPTDRAIWIGLVYLAAICSAFCFLIWNKAIYQVPAKELASTMHIKTPVAVLLGAIFAHESITLNLVIGSIIVAAGVGLSQWEIKWKPIAIRKKVNF